MISHQAHHSVRSASDGQVDHLESTHCDKGHKAPYVLCHNAESGTTGSQCKCQMKALTRTLMLARDGAKLAEVIAAWLTG